MNTKEREEIWTEYFDKLLYPEEPKKLIKIGNREINEFEVEKLNIVFIYFCFVFLIKKINSKINLT